MKGMAIVVLALLGCAVNLAAAAGSLTATPPTLELGLTTSLKLTCKFRADHTTAMTMLTSLFITFKPSPMALATPAPPQPLGQVPGPGGLLAPGASMIRTTKAPFLPPLMPGMTRAPTTTTTTTTPAPPKPVLLASVRGTQVRKITPFNGTVTGNIDFQGESILEIILPAPTAGNAGKYECRANGMDNYGRPTPELWMTNVIGNMPNQQSLEKKILAMEDKLKTLQSHMSRWEKIDNASSVFTHSAPFMGKQYLLSKNGVGHIDLSQFMCIIQGGYLAEINDKPEFDFIQSFVTNLLRGKQDYPDVFLGASDKGHKGSWEFLHNKGDHVYENWGGFATGGYDCMVLSEHTGFYMNDFRCDGHKRFLCEVPI